jgi:hypothetical protein
LLVGGGQGHRVRLGHLAADRRGQPPDEQGDGVIGRRLGVEARQVPGEGWYRAQ